MITLIFPRSPFLIHENVFPPLGILYLASHLRRAGYPTTCMDLGLGHKVEDVTDSIVGISFTTPQRFEAYKVLKQLKENNPNVKVIAGGAHPTHMQEECYAQGFDMVLRGECDYMLPKIMDTIVGNNVFGKTKAMMEYPCLDDLYFPDRHALPIHEYKYKIDGRDSTVIMTSRGCPFNCSFCARLSKTFRMQSAERTVAEIIHIRYTYGYDAFMIFDDVFIANKKRLFDIKELVKYDFLKFRCFGRAELLDEETCSIMRRMGVVEVGVGVESGSAKVLSTNFKRTTPELNARAIKNLHKYGIRAKAFIILGLPGETIETIEETNQWLHDNNPDDVDIAVFQVLPGSPIFDNPSAWGIEFDYQTVDGWYKGKPGEYHSNASTKELTSSTLDKIRDQMENIHKKKELLR